MGSRGTFMLCTASNPCLVRLADLCGLVPSQASHADRLNFSCKAWAPWSIDYTGPREMESSKYGKWPASWALPYA